MIFLWKLCISDNSLCDHFTVNRFGTYGTPWWWCNFCAVLSCWLLNRGQWRFTGKPFRTKLVPLSCRQWLKPITDYQNWTKGDETSRIILFRIVLAVRSGLVRISVSLADWLQFFPRGRLTYDLRRLLHYLLFRGSAGVGLVQRAAKASSCRCITVFILPSLYWLL